MHTPYLKSESGFTLVHLLIILGIGIFLAVLIAAAALSGTDPVPSFVFSANPPPTKPDGSTHCIGDNPGDNFTVEATATHPDLGTVSLRSQKVVFKILPLGSNSFVQLSPNPPEGKTDQAGKMTLLVTGAAKGNNEISVEATLTLPTGETLTATVGKYEVDPDCD